VSAENNGYLDARLSIIKKKKKRERKKRDTPQMLSN
jgi:hypothetical protein